MADHYWLGTVNNTWNGSNLNWGDSMGVPLLTVPTSSDNVIFDGNSGTANVTTSGGVVCNNCTTTAYAGTLTVASSTSLTVSGTFNVGEDATFAGPGTISVVGNVTYAAGANVTFTGVFQFSPTLGVESFFQPNGTTINHEVNPWAAGVTTLSGNVVSSVSTKAVHHREGTFNANNFNLTMGGFSFTGSIARHLAMGTGTWRSTSTSGISGWNITDPTNMTLDNGSSIVQIDGSGTGFVKSFIGGGLTYADVILNPIADTDVFNVRSSNSYDTLVVNPGFAATVLFADGTTQTIQASGSVSLSGQAGEVITLGSTTPGSTWSIAKTGGGSFSLDYVEISDCAPPVGTTIVCGANSIDGGGNNERVLFQRGIGPFRIGGSKKKEGIASGMCRELVCG